MSGTQGGQPRRWGTPGWSSALGHWEACSVRSWGRASRCPFPHVHAYFCVCGGFIWVLLEFLYSLSVGPEGWTKCRGKWPVLATAAQAVLAAIREQCLGTGPSWARGALPWFHAGPPTGHEEASGTPVTAEQVLPLQLQNVNLSWPASSVYERCGPGSARLVCGFMQEITFSIFRLPPL